MVRFAYIFILPTIESYALMWTTCVYMLNDQNYVDALHFF
jgi:hypothetical protein